MVQMVPKCSPNRPKMVSKWCQDRSLERSKAPTSFGNRFWEGFGSILAPQRTSKINKNQLFQRIDGKPKFEAFFSYILLWFFIDFQHLFKTVFVLTIRVDWKGGCSESPHFYNGFFSIFLKRRAPKIKQNLYKTMLNSHAVSDRILDTNLTQFWIKFWWKIIKIHSKKAFEIQLRFLINFSSIFIARRGV